MVDFARHLYPVNIEDEMRQSYMDYAMSVIVGRALPDARDGLKPVHRRVLFAMHEANIGWNRPYVKCARVVGDVMGKFHPHGDNAIYDTLVRMAQDFSLRYPLIDGQGNFGSIDGDAAAAMRYTECRLARISAEMLADIDRETVDFVPNYDGKELEPVVLPARVPNLLINGSSGIAVGMATNIPPHNLGEVVSACIALIDNPELSFEELIQIVPGPDFPTAGIINGAAGIRDCYRTGRGRIRIRAKAEIENPESDYPAIVVTELPYQVNKARLLEKIAELVRDKSLTGIRELRDESDKDGMRMVIELKRGESPEVLLNNLYKQTQMETVFGVNIVALVDGQPRMLDLRSLLDCFLTHRRDVVVRRVLYDLRKARDRAHILEGLAVALANIDDIIAAIKASPGPAEAREALMARTWPPGIVLTMLERAGAAASRPEDLPADCGLHEHGYRLSERQAREILDMRLQRLTALEQDKILDEYREILALIDDLLDILARPERLMAVIRTELEEVRTQYQDPRRTRIEVNQEDLSEEDLIDQELRVVTLSHLGYAKTQPLKDYKAQHRGGRGRNAASTRDEDFVEQLFVANSHDTLLFFSNRGKVYWQKVYRLPVGGSNARGRPLVNFLPLTEGEQITAVLPVKEFVDDRYVFMATRLGTVKKTPLEQYSNPRPSGIIAVDLADDDSLVGVALTDGASEVMLFSSDGKAVRFLENDVRPMGRNAHGVRGIRLAEDETLIAMLPVTAQDYVLMATQHGYGKRTLVDEFPLHGRGGQGVIAIQTTDRNGRVIAAVVVAENEDLMLISNRGTLVRTPVSGVRPLGRNTQGVRLINLGTDEFLVSVDRVAEPDDEVQDEEGLGHEASEDQITPDEAAADGDTPDHGGEQAEE